MYGHSIFDWYHHLKLIFIWTLCLALLAFILWSAVSLCMKVFAFMFSMYESWSMNLLFLMVFIMYIVTTCLWWCLSSSALDTINSLQDYFSIVVICKFICWSWFRLQGWEMLCPMLHTDFFKKMALFGSLVQLLLLQIVKELVNNFVWPLWYAFLGQHPLFDINS